MQRLYELLREIYLSAEKEKGGGPNADFTTQSTKARRLERSAP